MFLSMVRFRFHLDTFSNFNSNIRVFTRDITDIGNPRPSNKEHPKYQTSQQKLSRQDKNSVTVSKSHIETCGILRPPKPPPYGPYLYSLLCMHNMRNEDNKNTITQSKELPFLHNTTPSHAVSTRTSTLF